VLGGEWLYRPTDRTTISVVTDRSTQEAVFGTGKFFVATLAALSIRHMFLPKVIGDVRATAGENEFSTKDVVAGRTKFRLDTLLGWGAGLEYELQRWLRLRVDYSHAQRTSNFDEFSFSDDRLLASITLHY
jgi:hypothetical protein